LSVPDDADNGPGPVRHEVPPLVRLTPEQEPRPLETTATAETRSLPARPSAAEGSAGSPVDLRKHAADKAGDSRTDEPSPGSPAGADGSDGDQRDLDGSSGDLADGGGTTATSSAAGPSLPAAVPAPADGGEPPVSDGTESPQDREADDEWLTELLPIARTASVKAGRISRDAVKKLLSFRA
jgi:hypothetical protein